MTLKSVLKTLISEKFYNCLKIIIDNFIIFSRSNFYHVFWTFVFLIIYLCTFLHAFNDLFFYIVFIYFFCNILIFHTFLYHIFGFFCIALEPHDLESVPVRVKDQPADFLYSFLHCYLVVSSLNQTENKTISLFVSDNPIWPYPWRFSFLELSQGQSLDLK